VSARSANVNENCGAAVDELEVTCSDCVFYSADCAAPRKVSVDLTPSTQEATATGAATARVSAIRGSAGAPALFARRDGRARSVPATH